MNPSLILDHYWSLFHQTLHNLCIAFLLEESLILVILNWLLLIYENLIFQFLIYMVFFKYALLFVMIRSLQEGDPLKQVDFFIQCSKLKESTKSYTFLSAEVILKPPNNMTFSYVSKYMARLLDKLSKNTDLLWPGGLYAPTISHFLKLVTIIFVRI